MSTSISELEQQLRNLGIEVDHDALSAAVTPAAAGGESDALDLITDESFEVRRVTITPAMAEAWLKLNTRNRKIRPQQVALLARLIREGKWDFNGETIKFTAEGDIVDGQHRLLAIVQAGIPCDSLVVVGIAPETQVTIDAGNKRTLGDHLMLGGEHHYAILAAAVGQLYRYEHTGIMGTGGRSDMSTVDLLQFFAHRPGLRDSAVLVRDMCVALRYPSGVAAALWYLFSEKDERLAAEFIEKLKSGADLPSGSPILALREILLIDAVSRPRMLATHRAELTIRAWNAMRKGETLYNLRGRLKKFPKVN